MSSPYRIPCPRPPDPDYLDGLDDLERRQLREGGARNRHLRGFVVASLLLLPLLIALTIAWAAHALQGLGD